MAGTLAFSRFVVKDILRNRNRTISSIIGVLLAVSLVAGENIALDTIAKDVLAGELKDIDFDLYASRNENLTQEEFGDIITELESIKGVDLVLPVNTDNVRFEVNNDVPLYPPRYGFYDKEYQVEIPVNGSAWLNSTLEIIPFDKYRLYGYVYDLYTGEPLEAAWVYLEEGGTRVGYEKGVNTDSQGFYELFLPEAEYSIKVINYMFDFPDTGLSGTINITPSASGQQLDFHIPSESSSIKGYIDTTQTGGPYAEEAYVWIWNSTVIQNFSYEYYDYDFVDQDGFYSIPTIPGNISVFASTYYISGYSNHTTIEIEPGESLWLNMTLEDTTEPEEPESDAILKGHVYDWVSGVPLSNATIEIDGLDSSYVNVTETDVQGYYQINVISGNMSVEVFPEYHPHPFESEYLSQEIQLYLESGETRYLDFYLKPISSLLEGYLFSSNGAALGQARIDISDGGSYLTHYVYPDDGHYNLSVPAGTYNITIDAPVSTYPTYVPYERAKILGLPNSQDYLEFFQDIFSIDMKNGSVNIGNFQIAISGNIANEYGLEVGNRINLSKSYQQYDDGNETFYYNRSSCSFVISGIYTWDVEDSYGLADILMSKSDFDYLLNRLYGNSTRYVTTNVFVRINRDAVIDPVVRDLTTLSMDRLLNRVNSLAYSRYGLLFESVLDDALEKYYVWLEGYRLEMMAYSIPVVAVGFYLGLVGIELTSGQKRRVLGILKSRGAKDGQIFTSLMVEALILGIIAGLLGLIFGILVSRIFLTIIPGSRNISTTPDVFSLNLSTLSLALAMFFGVVLMLLASIRHSTHLAKAPVIESMRRYSRIDEGKKYRPLLDIILVCFAVFAYIVVAEVDVRYLDPEDLGLFFTILIIVGYLIAVVWLPFSPFILMFSLTRLFTRGTDRVYKLFTKILKPYTGNLWDVIHRNILRNPKRVSRVSIIIALALGFGVFLTTMIGSTIHGRELEARALVGADLNIETYDGNLTFEEDLKDIDGVKGVVPVNWLGGEFLADDDFINARIALFNASLYRQHVDVPDYYFVEGEKGDVFSKLGRGNYIVIGERIAQYYSLEIGSIIHIETLSTYSMFWSNQDISLSYNSLTVAGIVRALPGLEITDSDHEWGNNMYLDFSSVETPVSAINSGWHFLVDVEKDSYMVEESILDLYSSEINWIDNLDREIAKTRNDMPTNSTLYLMLINIGFLLIIITVGLGLVLFIAIGERKHEFATIMARGAEAKQIAVLIIGEALSITLVGVVVGVFSGLFTAYTFNKILSTSSLFGTGGSAMSDRPLVIEWYVVAVVLFAVLILMLTSVLAAYKAKRIKVHQALRIRGG